MDALDAHGFAGAVEPTVGVGKPEGGIGVAAFDKAIAIPAVHRTWKECTFARRTHLDTLAYRRVERHGSEPGRIGNTRLAAWDNADA